MATVSIVLPVYNGEKYLRQSIESCLAQTYKDFELIIVNDCSTDSSREIAAEFCEADSRVNLVDNEENQKLPNSLNVGFSHASGKYFTWTSDDNVFLPNAISKMVQRLEQQPEVGLVYADLIILDVATERFKMRADSVDNPHQRLPYYNCVGACFMYRADVSKKVGGYDDEWRIVEDYEYWLRLMAKVPVSYIDDVLYVSRRHSENLASTFTGNRRKLNADIQIHYLAEFEKSTHFNLDASTKALTYYRIWKNLKNCSGRTSYLLKALASCPALPLLMIMHSIQKTVKKKFINPRRMQRVELPKIHL